MKNTEKLHEKFNEIESNYWNGNLLDCVNGLLKLSKKEIILLTKADTTDAKKIDKLTKSLKRKYEHVFIVSVIDDKLIKNLKDDLIKILRDI